MIDRAMRSLYCAGAVLLLGLSFLEGKCKVVVVRELIEGNHRGTECHVLHTVLLFYYFI